MPEESKPKQVPAGSVPYVRTGLFKPDPYVQGHTNYDLSQYDTGMLPGADRSQHREIMQPWYDQAANFGVQVLGEITGGTISGVGGLLELPVAMVQSMNGRDADFSNAIMEIGDMISQGSRETNPIYHDGSAWDIGDVSWWLNNGVSISSSLSMLIPQMAVLKGLSWLGKLTTLSNKLSPATKYWSKVGAGAVTGRVAENMRESFTTVNDTYKQGLVEFSDPKKWQAFLQSDAAKDMQSKGVEITPENAAKHVASVAGWTSFKINSANLVFDVAQMAAILKGFNPSTRAFAGNTVKGANLEAAGLAKMGRMERIGRAIHPAATFAGASLGEGIEEAINYIGGEEGKHELDRALGTPKQGRLWTYLSDGHLWQSGFWGALGGAAYQAVGKKLAGGESPTARRLEEIAERQTTLSSFVDKVKAIESGEGEYRSFNPQQRKELINEEKSKMSYELGIKAAAAGNVDLLLEQIESPAFQKLLKEDMGINDDADFRKAAEHTKRDILQAEQAYKKHFNKLYLSKVSQTAKGMLLGENTALEFDKTTLTRKIDERTKEVTDAKAAILSLPGINLPAVENTIKLAAVVDLHKQAMALAEHYKSKGDPNADILEAEAVQLGKERVALEEERVALGYKPEDVKDVTQEVIDLETERQALRYELGIASRKLLKNQTEEGQKQAEEEVIKAQKEAAAARARKDEEAKAKAAEEAKEAARKSTQKVTTNAGQNTTGTTNQGTASQDQAAAGAPTGAGNANTPAEGATGEVSKKDQLLSEAGDIMNELGGEQMPAPGGRTPEKQAELVARLGRVIEELRNEGVETFEDLILELIAKYGPEPVQKAYFEFRGIYELATRERINKEFEDIYKPSHAKEAAVADKVETEILLPEVIDQSSLAEEVDRINHTEDGLIRLPNGISVYRVDGYKLITPALAIASLMRPYTWHTTPGGRAKRKDIDDSVLPSYHLPTLLPGVLEAGSKLTLKKSEKESIESFLADGTPMTIPNEPGNLNSFFVEVWHGDQQVGWLHDVTWIDESNTMPNKIDEQRQVLRDIRAMVAQEGEIVTEVSGKTPGTIRTSVGEGVINDSEGKRIAVRSYKSMEEAGFEDEGIITIATSESSLEKANRTLYEPEEGSVLVNKKDYVRGAPYVVIPTPVKSQKMAVPVTPARLDAGTSQLLQKAVSAFLFPTEEESKQIRDKIAELAKLDIFTVEGINALMRQYINASKFNYTAVVRKQFNQGDLVRLKNGKQVKLGAVDHAKGIAEYGRDKEQIALAEVERVIVPSQGRTYIHASVDREGIKSIHFYDSTQPKTQEIHSRIDNPERRNYLFTALQMHLDQTYFTPARTLLGKKSKFTHLTFENGIQSKEHDSYDKFLRGVLHTNLAPVKVEGKITFFDQPLILFSSDFLKENRKLTVPAAKQVAGGMRDDADLMSEDKRTGTTLFREGSPLLAFKKNINLPAWRIISRIKKNNLQPTQDDLNRIWDKITQKPERKSFEAAVKEFLKVTEYKRPALPPDFAGESLELMPAPVKEETSQEYQGYKVIDSLTGKSIPTWKHHEIVSAIVKEMSVLIPKQPNVEKVFSRVREMFQQKQEWFQHAADHWDVMPEYERNAEQNGKRLYLPTKEANAERAEAMRVVADNFEAFESYVIRQMRLIGYDLRSNQDVQVKTEDEEFDLIAETSEDGNEDHVAEQETIADTLGKKDYDSSSTWRIAPADTAHKEVKLFLSTIEDVQTWENGKPIMKLNHLGLNTTLNFNRVFEELIEATSDTAPTMAAKIEALERWYNLRPYFRAVVAKLQKADPHIRNQFVVAMSKDYWESSLILLKDKGAKSTAQVIGSNRYDLQRTIIRNWVRDQRLSPMVSQHLKKGEDGTPHPVVYINNRHVTDVIVPLFEKAKETLSETDTLAFLEAQGIRMSEKAIRYLKMEADSGMYKGTGAKDFKGFFTAENGVFRAMLKALQTPKSINQIEEEEDPMRLGNPLYGESAVHEKNRRILVNAEANNGEIYQVNSYRNAEGKINYPYALPMYISRRLDALKNDSSLRANLKALTFNGNASWLEGLDNSYFREHFKIEKADALKNSRTGKVVLLKEASERELEVFFLNSFINNNAGVEDQKLSRFHFLSHADKDTVTMIQAVRHNTRVAIKDGEVTDISPDTLDALSNLVKAEYSRILKFQKQQEDGTVPQLDGYKDAAGTFLLFPFLNQESAPHLWANGKLVPYLEQNVQPDLIEHVRGLIANKIATWKKMGIYSTFKDSANLRWVENAYTRSMYHLLPNIGVPANTENYLAYMASDYVINYLIANMNMIQLVAGDPALYGKSKDGVTDVEGTLVNMFKRLAKEIAPGNLLAESSGKTYRMIYARQPKISSQYLKDVHEMYGHFDPSDAQEFTTLAEHLYVMYHTGKLTEADYTSYLQKLNNDEEFSPVELDAILQPMKPVHVSSTEDLDRDVMKINYVKTSSFPLVPQLTRGKSIDKLRVAMEKLSNKGTTGVRFTFETGVKVGGEKFNDVFETDEAGRLNFKDNLELEYVTLPRDGLRIQMEIPYEANKSKVLEGSQIRKLLYSGLSDKLKPYKEHFEQMHMQLIQKAYERFIEEFGVENDTVDLEKLSTILQDEALKRGWTLQDIESLKLKDGKFPILPGFHPNAEKLSSLLNSLVTNRITKQYLPGRSYVLGSSVGFHWDSLDDDIRQSIIYVDGRDPHIPLRPPREVTHEDGTVTVAPGEVLLPPYFFDDKGKRISIKAFVDWDTNRIDPAKIPAELLNLIGYRIPTQGHNSMAPLQVVGFLPEYMGDLVIAYPEITAQMGSDYDVDKLYIYQPHHRIVREELPDGRTKLSHISTEEEMLDETENLQNEIIYSTRNVLLDREVFTRMMRPVGTGSLAEVAEKMRAITGGSESTFLSDDVQRENYLSGRGGLMGTANNALLSVFMAVTEGKDLSLKTAKRVNDELVTIPLELRFKVDGKTVKTADLSNPIGLSGKRKQEGVSYYISANVDNIKEQIIRAINYNKHTHKAVATALFSIGDERWTAWFTSQPIIRKLVERMDELGDNLEGGSRFRAMSTALSQLMDQYVEEGEITEEELKKKTGANWAYSADELEELATAQTRDHKWYLDQVRLLKKFELFSSIGEEITQLASSANSDNASKGAEKDLFASMLKISKVNKAVADQYFYVENTHKLFGTKTEEGDFAMTTPPGYGALYGPMLAVRLYRKLFPYTSPTSELIREKIQASFFKPEMSADDMRHIWKFTKSWLFSHKSTGLYSPDLSLQQFRQRLFFTDLQDKEGNPINESLAPRWMEYQRTEQGKRNFLANRLFADVQVTEAPSLVVYDAAVAERTDAENNIQALIDMLNGNEFERKLAEDTIASLYLNGGIQNAISFVKYVPIEYLTRKGFGGALEKLFNNLTNEQVEQIVDQYFQHYPEKLKKLDIADKKYKGLVWKVNSSATPSYFALDAGFPDGFPEYVAIKQDRPNNKLSGYAIYKRAGDNLGGIITDGKGISFKDDSILYCKIPNKGAQHFMEPNANIKPGAIERSVIPANNKNVDKFITQGHNPLPVSEPVIPAEERNMAKDYGLDKGEGVERIEAALNHIAQKGSPPHAALAKLYLRHIDKLEGIRVRLDKNLGAYGAYDAVNHTIIAGAALAMNDDSVMAHMILHEVNHALIARAIRNPRTEEQKQIVARLEALRLQARKSLPESALRKLEAVEEKLRNGRALNEEDGRILERMLGLYKVTDFAAELFSNPKFIAWANGVEVKDSKSIMEQFLDLIIELLNSMGISINKDSLMAAAAKDILRMIDISQTKNDDAQVDAGVEFLPAAPITPNRRHIELLENLRDRLRRVENNITNAKDPQSLRELQVLQERLTENIENIVNFVGLASITSAAEDEVRFVERKMAGAMTSAEVIEGFRILAFHKDLAKKVLTEQEYAMSRAAIEDPTIPVSEQVARITMLTSTAGHLYTKLMHKAEERVYQMAKEEGIQGTEEELLGDQNDISMIASQFLDATRTGNTLLAAKALRRRAATFRAQLEETEAQKERDAMFKKLQSSPLFKKHGFDPLWRRNKDGKINGLLTSPVTEQYWQELFSRADQGRRQRTWRNYFDWMRDNHYIVDTRKLYQLGNFTQADWQANYSQLVSKLGKTEADRVVAEARTKYEAYLDQEREIFAVIDLEESTDAEKQRSKRDWQLVHSPIVYLNEMYSTGTPERLSNGRTPRYESYTYVTQVPKEVWHDDNFRAISQDETYLEYYRWAENTLGKLYATYPPSVLKKRNITARFIPELRNSLSETFTRDGFVDGMKRMGASARSSVRSSPENEVFYGEFHPMTGTAEMKLPVSMLSREMEVADREMDIDKVLEQFIHTTTNYKYKSQVEDDIRLFSDVIANLEQKQETADGKQTLSRYLRKAPGSKSGLKNMKTLNEYEDRIFFGDRTDQEGRLNRSYSKEEQKMKDDIEQQIAALEEEMQTANSVRQAEITGLIKSYRKKLDTLGSAVVMSKVGRKVLSFLQLKVMGWNVFSGASELAFGMMTNFAHGSSNADFKTSHVRRAMSMMLNATGRALSGKAYNPRTAKKIMALSHRFDLLGDLSEGITDLRKRGLQRGWKSLMPMELQKRADYFSRGTTMIAMMLNTSVTDITGKTRTLWEAYDEKGEWRTAEFGEQTDWAGKASEASHLDKHMKFKNKLDQLIKHLHGNYDINSPMMIKKGILGAALMQFRSYMPEMISGRLEGENYDPLLGRIRKGRWITYGTVFNKDNKARGVPRIAKGMWNILTTLAKQATYRPGAMDGLSDVDQQNMRKNLFEIAYAVSLTMAIAALKALKDADDDDDDVGFYVFNALINQGMRLESDIYQFVSPVEFRRLNKDFLPAARLIDDTHQFFSAAARFISNDDIVKTGPYAGHSRLMREAGQMFPGTSAVYKGVSLTIQEYQK